MAGTHLITDGEILIVITGIDTGGGDLITTTAITTTIGDLIIRTGRLILRTQNETLRTDRAILTIREDLHLVPDNHLLTAEEAVRQPQPEVVALSRQEATVRQIANRQAVAHEAVVLLQAHR